uniref:Uncharacterized protein LOC111104769 isoform X1 n=1 Tax=Crassostrea virginica TaxID=6565 RepID=A0A8B8AV76_CRAVI|nr:uncharacterized protein LOC111104769 isoform X1 [Crassostrea virginica]XP_022294593.1 uncharacterized protein LOC111104769 isoform X1 [Crassostrea virginica]XP_022294594.1 uncharacterized protein LOC111104769 isoform X1 [Crassostrea virginica]
MSNMEPYKLSFADEVQPASQGRPRMDGTLWGFNTLEQTRNLGQQTYQRALKNYAAAWRDQQKTTVFPTHVYHGRFQDGPCPICGKTVESNHHLDSAFSEVMKMMSHISRSCEKYYCTTGKSK